MSAVGTQQKQAVTVGPNRISTEKNQAAFVANSQGAAVLENSEKIAVEQVGTKVIINGCYNLTNHYIHCSRDFVGGAKLTRYNNFPALIALCAGNADKSGRPSILPSSFPHGWN